MGIDSVANISGDTVPYGGKSAFTQLEHNIVAGYLITAGNFCVSKDSQYKLPVIFQFVLLSILNIL